MPQWLIKLLPDFLIKLFGFAEKVAENKSQKIPMQENAIREKADTRVINQEIKQDKKKDRHLRQEPKLLYAFNDHELYRECVNITEPPEKKPLYCGSKEEILFLIKQDPADVLEKKQARQLKEQVQMSSSLLFCIKLHPVSIHA